MTLGAFLAPVLCQFLRPVVDAQGTSYNVLLSMWWLRVGGSAVRGIPCSGHVRAQLAAAVVVWALPLRAAVAAFMVVQRVLTAAGFAFFSTCVGDIIDRHAACPRSMRFCIVVWLSCSGLPSGCGWVGVCLDS